MKKKSNFGSAKGIIIENDYSTELINKLEDLGFDGELGNDEITLDVHGPYIMYKVVYNYITNELMISDDNSIIYQNQALNYDFIIEAIEFETGVVLTSSVNPYINLLKELPDDTIVFKTTSGIKYTAKKMIELINNNDSIGKEYISDLMRISRDILKRQANK